MPEESELLINPVTGDINYDVLNYNISSDIKINYSISPMQEEFWLLTRRRQPGIAILAWKLKAELDKSTIYPVDKFDLFCSLNNAHYFPEKLSKAAVVSIKKVHKGFFRKVIDWLYKNF